MNRYDELVERRITKIIEESVQSKTKASFRPLQPKAQAVSLAKGRQHRVSFEELHGE